jgi:hypothetical protein
VALLAFLATGGRSTRVDAQTFTVLHSFNGFDGYYPAAGLVMDSSGNL